MLLGYGGEKHWLFQFPLGAAQGERGNHRVNIDFSTNTVSVNTYF
jgi:hypothetical protein